jgi:hypothetical protein
MMILIAICNANYTWNLNIPDPDGATNAVQRFRNDACYIMAKMTTNSCMFYHLPGANRQQCIPPGAKIVLMQLLPHKPHANGTLLHIALHNHNLLLHNICNSITTCQYIQETLQFGTTLEWGHFTQELHIQYLD